MSAKPCWLVARREFLDTVRTKTFWIGILSFPVILGLAVVVPMWLERSADVRRYAVVDRSGWLADLILIEGDPFEDISVLENPDDNLAVIMKAGRIVKGP